MQLHEVSMAIAPDGGTALFFCIVPQRSELMMARSPTGWNSDQTQI